MTRILSPIRARGGKARASLLRERRTLIADREERIRDLGGVMLELYRRGEAREELIRSVCDEILAIEQRLNAIDEVVTGTGDPNGAPMARCVCGAPLAWDASFCEVCGWPDVDAQAPAAPQP
jgi:hypothetical protein